jgi:hypothetical protein
VDDFPAPHTRQLFDRHFHKGAELPLVPFSGELVRVVSPNQHCVVVIVGGPRPARMTLVARNGRRTLNSFAVTFHGLNLWRAA